MIKSSTFPTRGARLAAVQMLSVDPPVISFEDFISDDEIAALLKHAEGRFVRSMASGQ
jgi:hypothetical protein